MNTEKSSYPDLSPQWRHAFRQHCLDIHPGLRTEREAHAQESEQHWLLREPMLCSIFVNVAVELRELGRWTGTFDDLDNARLLRVALDRIGLAESPTPLAPLHT